MKISLHFLKISEDSPNLSEGCTNIAEHFPKISKDYRRLPKTFEEDPKIFGSYINEFKYNIGDKLDITKASISSLVRIWKIRHSSPGCGFV